MAPQASSLHNQPFFESSIADLHGADVGTFYTFSKTSDRGLGRVRKCMEDDEPMPTSVEDLPLECLVEILEQLSAADISACACVCQVFREGATADCLWRSLCVRGQHGGALDFQEMLGCFSHADAQPLAPETPPEPGAPPPVRRHSSSSAAGKPWREVYKLSTSSLQNTVCIDTGRGYAK